MGEVEGVAAAGDVDVLAAAVEAVVGALVETAPRERHHVAGVLGRVVVDDVEQHLDAGGVQVLDHALELVEHALRVGRRGVGGVGGEEAHRVVAPVVPQAPQHEVGLVRERVHGQQLDGGDTQLEQVVDEGGVGEAGIRAAQLGWHAGVQAGRALDVHLVDEGLGQGSAREVVCAPVELGVDDDAARQVGSGVAVVAHRDVAAQVCADVVGVEGAVEVHLAVDGAGVGVEEELRGVVEQGSVGVPRAVDADGIPLPEPDAGDRVEPEAVGTVAQRHPALDLGAVVTRVEEADVDAGRMTRIDAELGARVDEAHSRLGGQVR